MSELIKRPLSEAQKKLLADKVKPSQEALLAAEDALFMYSIGELDNFQNIFDSLYIYLLNRLDDLQQQLDNAESS